MKAMEFVKYGFNITSFTATNKASNRSMSINFHKIRCPVNYNYWNLFNCSVYKDVKIFSKQSKNYTVYSKTGIKTNHVDGRFEFPLIYLCKTPDKAALVQDRYFIKVTSHSNICHCCYEQSYCNQ